MAQPEEMSQEGVDEESGLLEKTNTPRQRCLNAMRIDWRLVLFKIQYFFVMGAESVERVYLQLYLQQAGQSTTQIGIITGVAPFVVCLTDAIVVSLASKYRKSKVVLLVVSFAGALVAFGIAILPTPAVVSNCTLAISDNANISSSEESDMGSLYDKDDVIMFFYAVMIVHIVFSVLRNLTLAFTDVALFSVLGVSGMHKYSLQKSFGSIGSTFLDLGTGAVIGLTIYTATICGMELPFSNYQIAFYVICAIMFICFLCSWTFKFENNKEARNEADGAKLNVKDEDSHFSPKRLMNMFCSVHYISWILAVIYMGFCLTVINFAYLYIGELGGDAYLVGVDSGVTAASEFVSFILAIWIVPKLGSINSMNLAFLGYATRFAILALIEDPWLALLQASLGGIATAVSWVAIMLHAAEGFLKADRPAVIGIVHGLYFGLGCGTGGLIGGALIDLIGSKNVFGLMAGLTIAFIGSFSLAQKLSKRP